MQVARTCHLKKLLLSDFTIQSLVQKSCGLFIYAATVCHFICEEPQLASERLSRLTAAERIPAQPEKKLDQMYTTILDYTLNTQLDSEEMTTVQGRFHRIVESIVVLFDALSLAGLAMILAESEG
jgi:hypothetical protein